MNTLHATIWKDVRQYRPWAALAMVASVGAFVYAVHDFRVEQNNLYQPPMGPQFTMVTKYVSAFVGALLGLLVVVFDSRGDAWAFLVHRPAPRAVIFWGKLLAAWLLYVFAAGLPLVGTLAWLVTPGHIAMPYTLASALPSIADFLAGAVCVPLGMIVGQRPVRWYASRGLPLGAMFCVMASTYIVPEFWQSVLLSVIFGAIAVLAARGVFITGPSGARLPSTATAAMTAVIFSSLLVICTAASGIPYASLLSARLTFSSFDFAADGRVVVCNTGPGKFAVANADGTHASDLEKIRDQQAFAKIRPPIAELRNYRSAKNHPTPFWRGDRQFTQLSLLDDFALWYFVPQTGRLACYSPKSRRCLGTLGPAGFSPPGTEPADRFEGAPVGSSFYYYDEDERKLIVFPKSAYIFDPTARTVIPIFTAPAGTTITAYKRWSDGKEKGNERLCLLMEDRLINIDLQGKTRHSIMLPEELRKRDEGGLRHIRLIHFVTSDRYALAGTQGMLQSTVSVYDLDAAGIAGPARLYGPIQHVPDMTGLRIMSVVSAAVVGPMLVGAGLLVARVRQGEVNLASAVIADATPFLAAVFVSALLGMALCVWLARRWRLPRTAIFGWSVGGAAIGVLAPLVMLCVKERPVFVACPACAKRRWAASERCEHCNAQADLPSDGSEVFAPLTGLPAAEFNSDR